MAIPGESFAAFMEAHEAAIRLGCFLGVTLAVAGWEVLAPRRARTLTRGVRWPGNIGVAVLNTLAVRLLVPAVAVAAAVAAGRNGWGLFNLVAAPLWVQALVSIVLLDLAIYAQHVLFHIAPPLWRLHRMHHADLDVDVTTGARFHPIEILLSALLKAAAVTVLGAPAFAVIVFEVLLNATAMFNHGNVAIPVGMDRVLRRLVVTPDMHRIHHSVLPAETNSNYGFNLPWWDRLFGTYRDQPAEGQGSMTIGLEDFRDPEDQRLDRMLTQPFLRPITRAAI